MQVATVAVSAIASLAMTPLVSAATVTFTNEVLWNSFAIAQGNTVNIETFEAFEDGVAKSATATAGTTTWHASATPGPLLFSHVGGNQTIGPASAGVTLNFNFTPAVKGFGAHAYGLDSGGNVVPVIVSFRLADGSTYVGYAASATDFVGFYSTGSPIASWEWSFLNPDTRLVVDDLYLAAIGSVGDIDGDGQPDTTDNCPTIANPTQADCDSNGIGDVCETAAGAPDFNGDTVPDPCQCLADLFIDGQVNGADLGALLAFWGPVNPGLPQADMNRDGKVDGADLGHLLASWGPCQPAVVPSWATLIDSLPDPAVITDPALLAAIRATGLAWHVFDTATQMEFMLVPSGTFAMGCSASDKFNCYDWELPRHEVVLTNPVYVGRYEVTQSQWVETMGSNPSYHQGASYPDSHSRPVERVSWDTIQEYLVATDTRLLTEAEWEYACRAGTTTAFPNGSNNDFTVETIAWCTSNSGGQTQPVGGKALNGFGLYDMLGNVWEWTSDWYGDYTSAAQTNPEGALTGTARALRGGSWYVYTNRTRSSSRSQGTPDSSYHDIGFRVAKTP
jgi:formylglycine-generating enzyme required for sulfatase activity